MSNVRSKLQLLNDRSFYDCNLQFSGELISRQFDIDNFKQFYKQ